MLYTIILAIQAAEQAKAAERPMDPYLACSIAEGFCDFEPTIDDLHAAWQYLIDTGLCWTLQGWYGRSAAHLIEVGTCLPFPRPE